MLEVLNTLHLTTTNSLVIPRVIALASIPNTPHGDVHYLIKQLSTTDNYSSSFHSVFVYTALNLKGQIDKEIIVQLFLLLCVRFSLLVLIPSFRESPIYRNVSVIYVNINAGSIAACCLQYLQCTRTKLGKDSCTRLVQRQTYAIPLEVIYLTPLHKWNPYNIPHWVSHQHRSFILSLVYTLDSATRHHMAKC